MSRATRRSPEVLPVVILGALLSLLLSCGAGGSDPAAGDVSPETAWPDTTVDDTQDVAPDAAKPDVACEPSCAGRDCGDDGCGGACGACLDPCDGTPAAHQCQAGRCGGDCAALRVVPRYHGESSFVTTLGFLYRGVTCDVLDGHDLPAHQATSTVGLTVTDPLLLTDLTPGEGYAVFVMAENGVDGLAFGCADAVTVAPAGWTEVDVLVIDAPAQFEGLYELESAFDMGITTPPPSVASVVDMLKEISDDHDLYDADPDDGEYGEDPAAFLLDLLYRQICCWEALGPEPDWDSCDAQDFTHPFGDLTALYEQDFTTWEGAQPRWQGLCGALDVGVNELLQEELMDLIVDHMPMILLLGKKVPEELLGAFRHVRIRSELVVSGIHSKKIGTYRHDLIAMTVTLHDLQGAPFELEIDLAVAGMQTVACEGTTHVEGEALVIPPHRFDLDVGKLLGYIYQHGLLPMFGYDGVQDMLSTWIDCPSIGLWLEEHIEDLDFLDAEDYAGFCVKGLEEASEWVEDSVAEALDGQTFIELEGVVRAGELDQWHVAQTLVNGVWIGTWQEEGYTSPFPGTFEGELR